VISIPMQLESDAPLAMSPIGGKSKRNALVLAGAAAKGAFEAGAIAALAAAGIVFRSIVGTSSGALNAAFFALATRCGRQCRAAAQLVDFWLEQGHWRTFLDFSLCEAFGLRGLSRVDALEALMFSRMSELAGAPHQAVDLRLIATVLSPERDDGVRFRSHEHVFRFSDDELTMKLPEVVHAAVASAAFPGLMVPVAVEGVGECVDGGLVANVPLSEALVAPSVDRVFVVNPSPRIESGSPARGLALASDWVEIAVGERVSRDLAEVAQFNRQLAALDTLHEVGFLTNWQYEQLRQDLDLHCHRRVEVIEIAPDKPLPGNLLSGFGDRNLRAEYIVRGREAAKRALVQISQ
jgi:NTE family protein